MKDFESTPHQLFEGKASTAAEVFGVGKVGLVMIVCAYCVQAMKAKDRSSEAWSYAVDAAQWLGGIQGEISTPLGYEDPLLTFSARGVAARHVENRALKVVVFEWCDVNMKNYKSMDAAAQAVAGKIVPVVFRTARDWIGEWKKVRSAGTP